MHDQPQSPRPDLLPVPSPANWHHAEAVQVREADLPDAFEEASLLVVMDLGSESTTVMVAQPDENPFEADLQFYAYALAPFPRLFTEDDGGVAKRIRTRFFANLSYNIEWGQESPLKWALAYQNLVPDPQDYARKRGKESVVSNQGAQGPISYFLSRNQSGLSLSGWLPNFKIAFVAFPDRAIDFSSQAGARVSLEVEELLRLQITQILNQLVKDHPGVSRLWPRLGPRPWSGVQVILTVPNSYSMPQVGVIRNLARAACPGASVSVLSESDAVMMAQIDANLPYFQVPIPSGSSGSGRYAVIITLDVGKGTTDATVAEVAYSQSSKVIDVTPRAHTCRHSGGAKLTYVFLEFVQELAAEAAAAGIGAGGGSNAWEKRGSDPIPLDKVHTHESERLKNEGWFVFHLAQLEELIYRIKAGWTDRSLKPGSIPEKVAHSVADGILKAWLTVREYGSDWIVLEGDVMTAKSPPSGEAWVAQTLSRLRQLLGSLPEILAACEKKSKESDTALSLLGLDAIKWRGRWQKLMESVDDYVNENTDTILLELAEEILKAAPRGGKEALMELASGAASQDEANYAPRVLFVLAGKGSLFQPIQARLKQRCREARVRFVAEDQAPPSAKPAKGDSVLSSIFKWFAGDPEQDTSRPEKGSQWIALKDHERKLVCAKGGWAWWRQKSIRLNRSLRGQYVLSTLSGRITVDMEVLERDRTCTITIDPPVAPYLLYYPSRAQSRQSDGYMSQRPLPNCSKVTLTWTGDELNYEVTTEAGGAKSGALDNGAPVTRGQDNQLLEDVYPMVWPAILKPL